MMISSRRTFPQNLLAIAVMGLFSQSAVAKGDVKSTHQNVDTSTMLPTIVVKAKTSKSNQVVENDITRQFPATSASITAQQAATSINVVNTEDALKYLPNVLVRKRYIGDTNAPLATRTTGINGSARSLIFADDVLLSTLINNNNGNGSPQWFMVAPEEIARVDMLYGPYSAAYAGNSYGVVAEITTKMLQKFEASAVVRGTSQNFAQYGTKDHAGAEQYNVFLGDRIADFTWTFSAAHIESDSQPISFGSIAQSTKAASAILPAITGAIADQNRTGGGIQVLGAGNFVHTVQDNLKFKMAYDLSPTLTAAYALGYWQNNADANAQTYLRDAAGAQYYAASSGNVNTGGYSYSASGIAGQFSSNNVEQQHLMQSLTIKTHDQEGFNWALIASNMRYLTDQTRTSTGLYPAAKNGGAGRISDASGTGWSTVDLKGSWTTQDEVLAAHEFSFGAHQDWFELESPTYNTADWVSGGKGTLFSNSIGKTQTKALWLQDAWQLTPVLKATIGGRYEQWQATDGYNFSTASNSKDFAVNQPNVDQSGFSPKASLAWTINDLWTMTGSVGKALRFPTVGELYQNVQTGTTFTRPNPYLKPENVLSDEIALERKTNDSKIRVSVFQERVKDALISQTSMITGYATPVSFTQNVDKTCQRGIELVAQKDDVLVQGLSLSGNVTYVNAKILANSGYVPTISGAISKGKHTPYVPDWRATLVATYKPNNQWAFTLAGRYSGEQFATVDNTDINPDTYQGFQSFFVMDARANYNFAKHWSAALGVDNLNNSKYFLFHPFPQRTVFGELKYTY
ncbi:MAG: TonB-dependent receptor [Candidatus Saccharibacteria bacterium]|nr:TonB-dependent receptor [Moraxellaceae bacterium]